MFLFDILVKVVCWLVISASLIIGLAQFLACTLKIESDQGLVALIVCLVVIMLSAVGYISFLHSGSEKQSLPQGRKYAALLL